MIFRNFIVFFNKIRYESKKITMFELNKEKMLFMIWYKFQNNPVSYFNFQ